MRHSVNHSDSTQPQTVILHDYFAIRGGGERLVLSLADDLGAALAYGYRTDDTYERGYFPAVQRNLNISPLWRRSGLRAVALATAFSGIREWAAKFPVRIYSGVTAPFAAPVAGNNGVNIFYCHTPPRFLFDQRSYFEAQQHPVGRLLSRPVLSRYEKAFRLALDRMDHIVTNSENTQKRIEKYLKRKSTIIYPPCDTDKFSWLSQGDYYLSTARLTGLKRVDKIIEAFLQMPDKRLVVVSGGDEFEKLRKKADGARNIEFLGFVSEDQLREVVGRAIATIYIPCDEDFGMSPVESMAAGKPVIGVAEGGLLETVVPGETGFLVPAAFSINDIIEAVHSLTPEVAGAMRDNCETRAQLFSREKFLARMRALVSELR